MIVMNEIEYAKQIINSGKIEKKSSATVSLLARYYMQVENMTEEETYKTINQFMIDNYPFYNKVKWEKIIKGIISKANKYKLRNIESIGITQAEIDKIREEESEPKQRLLFTMLCFAKMFNKCSETNNGWINTDINEIFKTANVRTHIADEKYYMIHDIIQEGFLESSKKNDNINLRITFADTNDDYVLTVPTLEELGYEWLNYLGIGKYGRCEICGKLFKKTNNRGKYCKDCATTVEKTNWIKRQEKHRHF